MADLARPPVVNQYILEGTGVLDKKKWKKAVEKASAANPGTLVTLKGVLGFSKWVDSGISPPVREVDGKNWDGYGPKGAPFLEDRLDPYTGPTCEVLLIHGDIPRVMFRSHHASVDGMGQLFWMKDIFRALNDRPLMGSESTLTDTDLAKSFDKGYRKKFPPEHIAPTGKPIGNDRGVTWKRIKMNGKHFKALPQIAILLAKEAWKHSDGIVRFGIPVDMRIHNRKIKSTANLVFGITIEIEKKSTAQSIEKDILNRIQNKNDCMLYRGEDMYRYIPLWLMKNQYGGIMEKRFQKGRYNISGYLSNMGVIPLHLFKGAGFQSTGFFPIPPYMEFLPFFMGFANYGNENIGFAQELVITMPKRLANQGRIDSIFEKIRMGLKKN